MVFRRRPKAVFSLACPLFLGCIGLAVTCPLKAAEHWISLTTPHFEMYTTNGPGQAKKALETFERVRSFFLESSPSKKAPETPVRIVAFRSEKEFMPYRPNGGAAAYYQRSHKRDFIVMQDLGAENYHTAVHEYTHLIVEHAELHLPIWLNEGLADLYSSLEPKGNQSMVGRPIPGYLHVLATEKWLDLKLLTSVDQASPYYNQREKMQIFYAQSWALTHMLAQGKGYYSGFPKFVAAISGGSSVESSLQLAYGKTLDQVKKELNNYLRQATVQASVYDVKLAAKDLEIHVADLDSLSSELALADLLAGNRNKAVEAKQRLDRIAAEHPDNPEVEESLGYLAWQSGDLKGAEAHLAKAITNGASDPEMLFHYAGIARSAGNREASIAALKRALAVKSDYQEAGYQLGLELTEARQFGAALSTLASLKTVKPEHAFDLYFAMAYCASQLKSPDNAKTWSQKARQYARSPSDLESLTQFESYLNAPKVEKTVLAPAAAPQANEAMPVVRLPGLAQVTGVAKSLECKGAKANLHVQVNGREMVFQIADPKSIIVRSTKKRVR